MPFDQSQASAISDDRLDIEPVAEVELSIVVPALDEQDNVPLLVEQIEFATSGIDSELIIIDDGSTDLTLSRLSSLAQTRPWLKVLRHPQTLGQSAAMHTGIRACRGRFVATLDADLQNDPIALPEMLEHVRCGTADMVQGDRSLNRQDNIVRRTGSWVGRQTRRVLLGDPVRDTGCSLRVVRTELARQFPLQFKGMHRFLPAFAQIIGARVVEIPVVHRPRSSGRTKYGWGVFNRGLFGLFDCLAVRWMMKRYRAQETKSEAREA